MAGMAGIGAGAQAKWPLFVVAEFGGGCISGMPSMPKELRHYIVFMDIAQYIDIVGQ
jgi:hypothetical protein